MERDIEKDLIEIECAIKSQEEKDNVFTMSVLQRCHKLVSQLKEYKDLEEQGKLLKLPCAVGDTVYEIIKTREAISEFTVIGFSVSEHGIFVKWKLMNGIYRNLSGFNDDEIDKTVFLTREAAESTLKEL